MVFYLLTASFKPLPDLNFVFFDAAIWIASPVLGFLPVVALWLTEKVPKPVIFTLPPPDKAEVTAPVKASKARQHQLYLNQMNLPLHQLDHFYSFLNLSSLLNITKFRLNRI